MSLLVDEPVRIALDAGLAVDADLAVPPEAAGLVIFAHGSGSSRRSERNRAVAAGLRARGLATLLLDLLTPGEERLDLRDAQFRFDIELLAERLGAAARWSARFESTRGLPVAYFGASTGAAAALVAAAHDPERVEAIVSRGGRPDLAGDALAAVRAPTLLIVGGRDEVVLRLNREASMAMRCHRELEVVAGATHLFEEPGALDEVTQLAGDWFTRHLREEPG